MDFYIEDFKKKNKEDLRENPKCIFRLRQGVEKQRTILSSNKEAGLNLECLYDDIDYYNNLNREDFYSLN